MNLREGKGKERNLQTTDQGKKTQTRVKEEERTKGEGVGKERAKTTRGEEIIYFSKGLSTSSVGQTGNR